MLQPFIRVAHNTFQSRPCHACIVAPSGSECCSLDRMMYIYDRANGRLLPVDGEGEIVFPISDGFSDTTSEVSVDLVTPATPQAVLPAVE